MNTESATLRSEVILIDKPYEWTSFGVVKKVRYFGRFKKVGHAGTLDPLATGLLILCTEKKTKEIEKYQAQEKEYTGSLVLGKTTPSIDLETEFDGEFPIEHITTDKIQGVAKQLTGEIEQVPPQYSAVKVNGQRAYKAARDGKTVEIKSRIVEIKTFEVDASDFPTMNFRVVCSKGTYIRTLVSDFGKMLDSGAYMSSLRRTRIGEFHVDDAITVEDFVSQNPR